MYIPEYRPTRVSNISVSKFSISLVILILMSSNRSIQLSYLAVISDFQNTHSFVLCRCLYHMVTEATIRGEHFIGHLQVDSDIKSRLVLINDLIEVSLDLL